MKTPYQLLRQICFLLLNIVPAARLLQSLIPTPASKPTSLLTTLINAPPVPTVRNLFPKNFSAQFLR